MRSSSGQWRMLQTSDHFYYMCTKWFADGDVHRYFNPYESPYEAYINYMNILDDLSQRVKRTKQRRNTMPETSHYLFEVSWEVCNKVGGIYTVITSKLPEAIKVYGEHYFLLGPDLKTNLDFEETDEECWNAHPGGDRHQGDPLPLRPLEGPRRTQGDPGRLREKVRQGPAPLPALGGLRRRFHRRGVGLRGTGHVQLCLQRGDRNGLQPPGETPGNGRPSPSSTNG